MLLLAYFFYFLSLQGDHYGIWYDTNEVDSTS